MRSKRKLSIAIISVFILSVFTSLPTALAISISVSPSSVNPWQTVVVTGQDVTSGVTVDIFIDQVDDDHYLGSVTAEADGGFSFTFIMYDGDPGTHRIWAKDLQTRYTAYAEFELNESVDMDPPSGGVVGGELLQTDILPAFLSQHLLLIILLLLPLGVLLYKKRNSLFPWVLRLLTH